MPSSCAGLALLRLHAQQLRFCSGMQTTALQRALGKFNIAEVARTGKICLKRGEALLDMGGWGDGQLKQMRDQKDRAQSATSHSDGGNGNGGADLAGASARGVDEGQDVYASGGNEKAGEKVSVCFLTLVVHVTVVGREFLTGHLGVWRQLKQEVKTMIGFDISALLCAMSTIYATVLMSATRYARCV